MKPLPMAPPIMLKPLICVATFGYVANSKATFVSAPVATSHVSPGYRMSASYIARMTFGSVTALAEGKGRHVVPSRPLEPELLSIGVIQDQRLSTMYIRSMHSIPAERLCSARVYGHVFPPYCFQNTQSISCSVLEGSIAVYSADSQKIKIGMAGSQKDGKSVLVLGSV